MAMSLGWFAGGFVAGLTVGEVGLLFSLALFGVGEPSGKLPDIETEGSSDLVPSLQERDALA